MFDLLIQKIKTLSFWKLLLLVLLASQLLATATIVLGHLFLESGIIAKHVLPGMLTAFPLSLAAAFPFTRLIVALSRAEKALQAENRIVKDILDNSAVASFVLDPNHTVLFWNKACEELTGVPAAEMIGTRDHWKPFYARRRATLADVVIDGNYEDLHHLYSRFSGSVLNKDGLHAEGRYGNLNGRQRDIIFDAAPIHGFDGRLALVIETLQDVTSQKLMEEDLKQVNETLRSVIQASPIAVVSFDLEGKVGVWNPAAEKIFGWSEREVRGRFNPIIEDHQRAEFLHLLARVLQGEQLSQLEVSRRNKTGDQVNVAVSSAPVRNSRDEAIGIISLIEDTTERRRAAGRLRQSEERFRTISEIAPVMIAGFDRSGRCILWNRECERTLGWLKKEAFVCEDMLALFSPEPPGPGPAQPIAKKDGVFREVAARTRDGSLRHQMWASFELQDGSVIVCGYDITEQKQAETALRESEQRYRSLIDAANEAILVADIQTGTITEANKKAEELFGRPVEQLIGMHQSELHPRGESAKYRRTFQSSVHQGKGLTAGDLFIENSRRERIPVEISVNQFEAAGRKVILGIFRDITERKSREEELQRARNFAEKLIRTANVMVVVLNAAGEVVELNQTGEAITGYRKEELRGKNWFECVVPPVRQPEARSEFERLSSGRAYVSKMINPVLTKAGEERIISWQNSSLVTDQGTVTVSFGMDITEQKIAEELLQRSEERLRTAQQVAHIGSWELDLERNSLNWSDEIFRIFEIDPARFEASYEAFLNAVHPDDRDMVNKAYTTSVEERTTYAIEHRLLMPDGRIKFVREICRTNYDDAGKPVLSLGTVQDITEQRLAQESLRESRERLNFLISNSPAMIYTSKASGDFGATYISPNIVQHLGYLPEEFMADRGFWEQHVHPEDKERVFGVLPSLFERGIHSHEYRFRHKDGSWRWMHDDLMLVRDAEGMPLELIGSWSDITARRNAEERLRESEERYRRVVENTSDAIFIFSFADDPRKGSMDFISGQIEQMTGYCPEDFYQDLSIIDAIVHPDDQQPMIEAMRRVARGEDQSATRVYRVRKKADPGFLWIEDKLVRQAAERAGRVSIFGVIRDITERRKSEEALRRSEERFRSIANTLPDLIYRLGSDGAVSYVSLSIKKVLGFEPSEAVGRHFTSFVHDDDRQRAIEANRLRLDGLPTNELELKLVTKSGGSIYASINSVPIEQDGRVVEVQGVVRDITERKKTEDTLLASLSEKETLLREIHHRVKNNLQIIASLLYLQSEGAQDEETQKLFQESRDRIKSMAIVHEKLYRTTELARVELKSYLESLTSYLLRSYAAEAHGVSLELRAEGIMLGIDIAVPCGLIVNELVSNALKHAFTGRKKGVVTITASFDGAGSARLTVADDGWGIPGDRDLLKAETLGMRLVDNLVKQLHGTIEITGGRGTCVALTFPLHHGKEGRTE